MVYDWCMMIPLFCCIPFLPTLSLSLALSLCVTGYGSVAPRTVLGRMITLAYAVLGIPLTLVYLSSTGGMLAKVARGVFSR